MRGDLGVATKEAIGASARRRHVRYGLRIQLIDATAW